MWGVDLGSYAATYSHCLCLCLFHCTDLVLIHTVLVVSWRVDTSLQLYAKSCRHKMSQRPCYPSLHSRVKLNSIEMVVTYTKGEGNDLRRYQETVSLQTMQVVCIILTVVSSDFLPPCTAVSTQSKRAY